MQCRGKGVKTADSRTGRILPEISIVCRAADRRKTGRKGPGLARCIVVIEHDQGTHAVGIAHPSVLALVDSFVRHHIGITPSTDLVTPRKVLM